VQLPFNPEDPPHHADPLLWRLARMVHQDHQPDSHGWCIAMSCRQHNDLWPCPPSQLAACGLIAALSPGRVRCQISRRLRRRR
jgi:hypothetical protein